MNFSGAASLLLFAALSISPAQAHVNGEAGWLHPLSGLDHLLAMISVGAWSSQIGGRAIWVVPSAFVCFMFLGGLAGFEHLELPATEIAVSLSVVLLGLAIFINKRFPVAIAASATALFGIFHGYAHGYEMPLMDNKVIYTLGFLSTTALLHAIGAVGGYFMLKTRRGDKLLRLLGGLSMICGIYLVFTVI
ncbi:TPA: HupE/UreJ family protein [Enterobacter hormaechei subsp. steigerwaltii]|nr:HupE/UreJ family protein [Enterobacter hormaechei subsp. steigerwaltii]